MKYVLYVLMVLAVCFILTDLSFSENQKSDSAESSLPEETISETEIPETKPVTTAPVTTAATTESIIITTAPPETTAIAETTTEETTTVPETTTAPETTVTEAVTETTTAVTESAPISENAESVLRTAMEQLDKPYSLGGETPQRGFDSSGLIYYACKQNGIDFPRYSAQQSKAGTEVSYRDLKAGDFMYLSMDNSDKISYCGIYLGDGTMLYSSTNKGKVLIINVSSPYWEQHMVTARRIS